MRTFIRVTALTVLAGAVAWACSGSETTQGSSGSSGSTGTPDSGIVSGSGGGTTGTGTGTAGSAGSGTSTGGSSSTAGSTGAGGSTAGSGGSTGAGGATIAAFACAKDDDCILAVGHSTKGCCSRGCQAAFNRNYVATEPCVSADPMTDPVPASCDTGCMACPGSHCQEVYGAACLAGQCATVTQYGPCSTDDDCVVAIDYASTQGGCCSCPEIASKLLLAKDHCVVPKGQPKPDGCAPTPAGVCASLGCPAQCPNPTMLKCTMGACTGT